MRLRSPPAGDRRGERCSGGSYLMRVLWLSHFVPYPPTGHGALQRTHHLLREAARRHEVHVVARAAPGSFFGAEALANAERALGEIAASVRLFPIAPDARGTRRAAYAALASAGGRTYWERWLWSAAMYAHTAELMRRHRFDLVHADAVFLAPYLRAVPGVPLALNHHNLESHLLRRRAAAHPSRARAAFFARQAQRVAALERRVAPQAAVNLTVSDLDGDRLAEIAPGTRNVTVPNGVDTAYFRATPGISPVPRSLVFAGGMDWFPNHAAMQWLATELWPLLARDEPERSITVVGRNPPRAVLELAQRDGRVRVLGYVDDVRPHIDRAAVYVCPIKVGGGTRLKILDALAMARPLVSTAIGVEGLGLTEGTHYLGAETPAEFSAQLRRLDDDPTLGERLATAGRAFVEKHYTWPKIGIALNDAYDLAVGGAAATRERAAHARLA